MRFTRRKLVGILAASPALAQVASKVPPVGVPETGSKKAVQDVHSVSERLAQIEVPMNIEPAFAFKA